MKLRIFKDALGAIFLFGMMYFLTVMAFCL